MYIEKTIKPGYTKYTDLAVENGYGTFMEVGLLLLEEGMSYTFFEDDLEVSFILMSGKATLEVDGQSYDMERDNPFSYNPWCLLMAKGQEAKVTATSTSEFYVQKSENDRDYATKVYTPEETHTWHRGDQGELGDTIRRDVRTCYDYETRPDSNMVLGEVVNLPGKWSSYPPHSHPQPEVYFYFFEKEQGFGAGWSSNKVHEVRHHGCLLVTDNTCHSQVMAPGYACCYVWGIRHLPDNPWEKTRIDDPQHEWLLAEDPKYWTGDQE